MAFVDAGTNRKILQGILPMKITLAGSTLNKKNVLPRLPRVGFEVKDTHLVYLPFSDMGHEMVHPDMRISINKNALRYGRQL